MWCLLKQLQNSAKGFNLTCHCLWPSIFLQIPLSTTLKAFLFFFLVLKQTVTSQVWNSILLEPCKSVYFKEFPFHFLFCWACLLMWKWPIMCHFFPVMHIQGPVQIILRAELWSRSSTTNMVPSWKHNSIFHIGGIVYYAHYNSAFYTFKI